MAAEKFIFTNFTNISKTDSFTNLNDDELHELIEAAIESDYCSTNDILSSLHRWVVTTPADHNTQSDDVRINTFLTLVKELPRDEFDEKIFAEIFLDDHRLRDNAMCRNFRDDYLCEFFKKHIERNNSSGVSSCDPRRTPERGMKRKVENVEVDEARKRVNIAVRLEELSVEIETTSEPGPGIESNVTTSTTTQILENSPSTASTSAQQRPGIESNVTTLTVAQILEKSPSIASTSAQQPPVSSISVQQAVAVATDEKERKTQFRGSVGRGNCTKIISGPSTASTSAQQPPVSSTSAQQAAAVATDEKEIKTQFRGSIGRGNSTKIISGGDGSDCIGYFTSKENDSWIIGSFNLATGDVEKITDIPSYRDDGALIHAYNYLYYIGGRIVRDPSSDSEYPDGQEVKGQVSRRIDIFDMTARNWITENLPQLNEAREDFQRCVCGRYIYIIGGMRTDGSDIDSVEYVPLYGTSMPMQRDLPQQEENSDEYSDENDDCALFSLQGHIYHTDIPDIPKVPGARTGNSTAVYKSKLYVFGGARKVYNYKLASACVYDKMTNVWTMLPNMHRKRYHAATVHHNNFIYIIGGDDGGQIGGLTIEKFNPATKEFQIIHNWLDKVPSDVNFYLMAPRIE